MRFPTLLMLSPLLGLSTAQVRFTQPDPSKPLNLSQSTPETPIFLSWIIDHNVDESKPDIVYDIWLVNNARGFGYELLANAPSQEGTVKFAWFTKDVVQALEKSGVKMGSGTKEVQFELKFHRRNETRGSSVMSEKFAVEGYKLLSTSGGGKVSGRVGMVVVLLWGLGALVML